MRSEFSDNEDQESEERPKVRRGKLTYVVKYIQYEASLEQLDAAEEKLLAALAMLVAPA